MKKTPNKLTEAQSRPDKTGKSLRYLNNAKEILKSIPVEDNIYDREAPNGFDTERTIAFWLESAAYDLETGKSLLESKRFPYALFFAHLTLEKTLKALVVKATKEHAPYTHSLALLASKTGLEMPEQILDQLAEYMEFHIESRYPDDRKDFYKKCTEEFTRSKFTEMEDLYKWLLGKL